ncbi:MAG: hypothetical protein ACXVW6_01000 [Nocardioidaceae bacterium]
MPRIAEAAVERARLTVVPRRAQRAARVPFVTQVSLLLVLGVAGLLFFNTSMQQASFKATALEDQANVLDARQQSLQMQLATLRNPQRVAERAQRMGMVPPTSPAFLRLSDGKVLGSPVPASSANAMRINDLPAVKPLSLRPRTVVLPLTAAPQATAAADNGAAHRDTTQSAGTKAHKVHRRQGSGR